jgi:glycosyltransferase involved in cell wall biosynthesis
MPLVSVVIPTHHRSDMLAEALASVRAQTFTNYEIIVVSNGEMPENRKRSEAVTTAAGAAWSALPFGNSSAARNFGVAQAKGDWIAFLDDDDGCLKNSQSKQTLPNGPAHTAPFAA